MREIDRLKLATSAAVVHAHFLYSDGAVALRLCRTASIPFVVTVRNTDLNYFRTLRPDLRLIAHAVLRKASAVLVPSPAYGDAVLRGFDTQATEVARKLVVLPNGLSPVWSDDAPSEELAPSGVLRVLYVGDFTVNKNVPGLIAAVRELAGSRPVTLTLVGGGGNGSREVEALVRADRDGAVTFQGKIEDPEVLKGIYRAHDVFAMPSFRETFGLVYLEALSQGLPVLHSTGQGVSGYFPPGTVAEAVDPADPASIASGLVALDERLPRVRKLCIESARRFSWEKVASQLHGVYAEVVAEGS
jgi:glycosyltransferase involved in cell wall biosynthesis